MKQERAHTLVELWCSEIFEREDDEHEFLTQKKRGSSSLSLSSEKTTVFQVVLNDDVGDGVKDELHILGVCGAGEVGVNLLGVLPLVQVLKLTLDVGSCFLVRIRAWQKQMRKSQCWKRQSQKLKEEKKKKKAVLLTCVLLD